MLSNIKQSFTEVGEVCRLPHSEGFGPASGFFFFQTQHIHQDFQGKSYIFLLCWKFTWDLELVVLEIQNQTKNEEEGSVFLVYTDNIEAQRETIYKRLDCLKPASTKCCFCCNGHGWGLAMLLVQCLLAELRNTPRTEEPPRLQYNPTSGFRSLEVNN